MLSNRSTLPCLLGALILPALCLPSPSLAQDEGALRLTGVLEHYFGGIVEGSTLAGDLTARWFQVKGETAGGLGFTAGTFQRMSFRMLDENYLELDRKGGQWRLGRIRSRFGHAEWGDQWYNGFPNLPLMRVTRFSPSAMLSRFDSGIDFRSGNGSLEYSAGVVDIALGTNEVLSSRPDHLTARLQTYQSGVILGLNALFGRHGTELFNLDWRWSSPQWIIRGEILRGRMHGFAAEGHYLDVYFHPLKQFRTTLLGRLEESGNNTGGTAPAPGNSRMVTLGVKQVLSPEVTLSATHGWGNRPAQGRGVTGWAVQAIHFLRF